MPERDYGIVNGVATYWVTKDGRRLPLVEMTDSHLHNVINFIERNRVRAVVAGFGDFYSEASEAKLKGLKGEARRRAQEVARPEPQTVWERLLGDGCP